MTRALLLASAYIVVLFGAGGWDRDDPVTGAIRATTSNRVAPPPIQSPRWKLMQQVYRDLDYRPLWIDGGKLRGPARDLIETLCHAEREGLRAADYDLAGLRAELVRLRAEKDPSPRTIAALDLRLTRSFLDYGADLLAGRLDPKAVDNGWYIRARRASIDTILRSSLRSKDFDDMIAPFRPGQREYTEMVDALESYREVQAKGGWPRVPAARKLALGAEGPSVEALRHRLAATGELRDGEGKPIYDDEVALAVAKFQVRHGLPPDGTAGPATLAALNVTVETRIRQIEL